MSVVGFPWGTTGTNDLPGERAWPVSIDPGAGWRPQRAVSRVSTTISAAIVMMIDQLKASIVTSTQAPGSPMLAIVRRQSRLADFHRNNGWSDRLDKGCSEFAEADENLAEVGVRLWQVNEAPSDTEAENGHASRTDLIRQIAPTVHGHPSLLVC